MYIKFDCSCSCAFSIVYCIVEECMETEPSFPSRAAPSGIGVVEGMHIPLCKCNGTY